MDFLSCLACSLTVICAALSAQRLKSLAQKNGDRIPARAQSETPPLSLRRLPVPFAHFRYLPKSPVSIPAGLVFFCPEELPASPPVACFSIALALARMVGCDAVPVIVIGMPLFEA